jgi:hypothetical protein
MIGPIRKKDRSDRGATEMPNRTDFGPQSDLTGSTGQKFAQVSDKIVVFFDQKRSEIPKKGVPKPPLGIGPDRCCT